MMYTSLTSLASPLRPPLSLFYSFPSTPSEPIRRVSCRHVWNHGPGSCPHATFGAQSSILCGGLLRFGPGPTPYHPDREQGKGRVHQANIPNIPNIPNAKRVHWAEHLKASDDQARALG